MRRFNNKRVLLTGAASGVGRELAIQLANNRPHLILIDLNLEGLISIEKDCLSQGATVEIHQTDIIQLNAMKALAEKLIAEGGVDFIFANAGVGGVNPGDHFSFQINQKIMDVNFYGTINTIMPFVPHFIEKRAGHIISISSLASLRGLPSGASYSASKAALNNFIESIRIDLKPYGIKISNILPGFLKTPMTEHDEFPLPFLVSAKDSASKIIAFTEANKRRGLFPLPMAILAQFNRLIPGRLYDWIHTLITRLQKSPNSERRAKLF